MFKHTHTHIYTDSFILSMRSRAFQRKFKQTTFHPNNNIPMPMPIPNIHTSVKLNLFKQVHSSKFITIDYSPVTFCFSSSPKEKQQHPREHNFELNIMNFENTSYLKHSKLVANVSRFQN